MKRIEKNINRNYLYQCIKWMDMTGAIWVLYLAFRGMNLAEIGILEGIFHFTSLTFEVPTGAIADLLGRKRTIVLSRGFAFISSILMISATHFWGFAVAFVISAMSYNLASGAEEALVYDSLKQVNKEDEYIKVNGRMNFIIEVMQGVGAFIGAFLAQKSFLLSYLVAAVFAIIALVIALGFTEPENKNLKKEVSVKRHFKESYEAVLQNKGVVFLLLFYPAVFAFSAILYFYGQHYFSLMGYDKIHIAVIFLGNSLAGGVGAILSGKVEVYLKGKTGYVVALGIGIGMIIFSISYAIGSIILFCTIGFLTAILQPISSDALNEKIPSEQRATLISVQSAGYSLMMILFFPLAGFLGDHVGIGMTFAILGMVLIGAIGIAMLLERNGQSMLMVENTEEIVERVTD